jgi:hypothetical protein
MRFRVFIIFILLSTGFSYAQQFHITREPHDKELFVNTMNKIYNLEFAEAESLLIVIKHRFPNHPSYHMLMAMKLYWEMTFVSKDHPKFNEYSKHLEMVVKLSQPLLNNNTTKPEACFFLIGAHTSLAYVNSKNNDFTSVLSQARLAYKYMKEGFVLKDKYPDFHFSTGLYNFYVTQYPESNPILKPFMWLFADGDKQFGIKEIEKGADVGIFSKTEAICFLVHILLKYENKPAQAVEHSRKLAELYPKNSYFMVRFIEALLFSGHYNEALVHLAELEKNEQPYFKMVSMFFEGMYAESNNDKIAAKTHYLKCIQYASVHKLNESDYVGLAYWRTGRMYEEEKNEARADEYFDIAEDKVEYNLAIEDVKRYKNKK